MDNLVLIDTDILIDVSKGINEAIDCLQIIQSKYNPAVSVITKMEFIVGCRNKNELRELNKFLQIFRVIQINEMISQYAMELLNNYRLSFGLLIADALIAATAIQLGQPFISKNQRDYQFIKEIKLLKYPLLP